MRIKSAASELHFSPIRHRFIAFVLAASCLVTGAASATTNPSMNGVNEHRWLEKTDEQADNFFLPIGKLLACHAAAGDGFGFNVAISGNTAIVGGCRLTTLLSAIRVRRTFLYARG